MIRSLAATGAIALAIFPAAASAHPQHRGFTGTYPYASLLCLRASTGHLPKSLSASSDQVKAACQQLHSEYTVAQSAYRTAVAAVPAEAASAVTGARATCQRARQTHDRALCRGALAQARQTLRSLRDQVNAANQAYHAAVEAARKAFWTTIHGLRGGAGIKGDTSAQGGPSAAVQVPGNTTLPQS